MTPVPEGKCWPPGFRLASYEIVAPLGAGGMGEVYRARDTNLKRDVALKVLPDAYARDPGRMARFQREAEVLASLNHPNIAQIYGVEERALVMELVEGESPKGPMPFDDAWKIALQIADALEYAHERGVIHRDLKPSNVKVTPEGVVKLLDFGLAKAFTETADSGGADPENSPTVTIGGTVAGVILGTAAYMAPEQAKGKRLDKRADIWSWGVVLYELLTGERLFQGDDVADTLAAVIHKQPDLKRVPPNVRKLLRSCLEKDPKKRLRDVGDARYLLEDSTPPAATTPSSSRLAWAVAAALLVALTGLAFLHFREYSAPQRSLRLSVPLPENSTVDYLSLSPDGQRLALVLTREGQSQIYIRPLSSGDLQPLSGATGLPSAGAPLFWSPDSRIIGFFAEGKLKTIPAAGGPVEVLCEEIGGAVAEGTWSPKGVILFANSPGSLWRVDARGGPCTGVGKDVAETNIQSLFPVFLPDGDHFLYARRSQAQSSSGVYLATLEEPVGHRLLPDLSNVIYATPASRGVPAHLLFRREDLLMAQPFVTKSLQAVGDPFPVAADLIEQAGALNTIASAATDGTLAYLAGPSGASQLTWYDREGNELGKVGPRAEQYDVALSPDGNTVAILRRDRTYSTLWLHDLTRASDRRVTSPGPQINNGIVWSPDSRFAWFITGFRGRRGIYQIDRDGGSPELVEKLDTARRSLSDRKGSFLLYTEAGKALGDIWYVPVDSGKPRTAGARVVGADADAYEAYGQLSPDGSWLAYCDIGRLEVYIRPFPNGPGVWPVSGAGPERHSNAFEPRWSTDGKQLYFLTGVPSGRVTLMAVEIQPDGRGALHIGSPQRLFDFRAPIIAARFDVFSYSPHPDGKRFLVNALVDAGEPAVNIITNWQRASR
jgi:serine/threonine protein kinase